jgi:nitrite reductase (NO-forming)
MSDHNSSGRLWATAALIVVPFAARTELSWWLPLHMVLLGVVTQGIVGGQLMFSATLGLARGPSRAVTLTQLGLLNLAALAVIVGRWSKLQTLFVLGAMVFVAVIGWVAWQVDRLWRSSINRRFAVTGTFYRLAAASLLLGASIGGALGVGAFEDATSYIAHRGVHMTLNVFGWAGMTIVGTAITLLPTILHVRAPKLGSVRRAPWTMFLGLMVMSTGATTRLDWVAGVGMAAYLVGLAAFLIHVGKVLATPSRRKIPTAALHLVAAIAWALIITASLVVTLPQGDWIATRDFVVIGGAVGFAFQALLGAWSFLLPSTRAPIPERRRIELIAMELGGRTQVVTYNVGLILILAGLQAGTDLSVVGATFAWTAAVWALTKAWFFPLLSRLPSVERRAAAWWADPQ